LKYYRLAILSNDGIIKPMIKTYANKETQRIAENGNTRKFPHDIVNRAIIRLN